MLIKNARIYHNTARRFVHGDLLIENRRIREIGEKLDGEGDCFDADGAFLVPGLIDVHTHGRVGFDFVSCSSEQFGIMAADYARHGVTTVMPTLASAPFSDMLAATEALCRFLPHKNESKFCGVHWEGRYLNPDQKGAHSLKMLAPLLPEDLEREVFRMCRVLHMTAAYELDPSGAFAQKALALGATLGLGHTNASYEEAKRAELMGVTAYTHLFNAMPPLRHRDGGAVCAALEGDGYAELICDGVHVSPEMVRLTYRVKGAERLTLISDSMEAAGCLDGAYSIAGNSVLVKDGIARTQDGALAGSTLSLDQAVNNLMDFCNIPLTDAILSATESPAKQMGLFDACGSIEPGKRADVLFLKSDKRLEIDRIMLRGSWLF